jgi:hypothetical protein
MIGKRKGMLLKNISEQAITLELPHRVIELPSGGLQILNAVEVQLATVRAFLQQHILAVVRPAEDHEA